MISGSIRLLFAASALALAACGQAPPQFRSVDITGAPFSAEFRLEDQNGNIRTLADFKGKVVAIFFGFTNCPDVCPTTLSELKSALASLGPDTADDVRVLFVTLDPERDTPALLAAYLGAFDPGFVGLRGSSENIQAFAKGMRVFHQRTATPGSGYTVDHFAGTYVLDREGRVRLMVPYGAGAEVFAHDLRALARRG